MLEANNITFRAGARELLADISVAFEPGKLHLIIGPNGAGKSTLVKVLAGLLDPQMGTVSYKGVEVRKIGVAALAKHRAVLSQAIEIAFPLTVREVVIMGRSPHFGSRPGPVDERIADELMELFDVTEFGERNYQTLSGGERQRVNFARVLAQLWLADEHISDSDANRYLFLDEPLTFLDIRHQIEFMKKIREFSAATDVVTVGVVHDLNLAARFADRIFVMDRGRMVASGEASEVLTPELLRDVFAVEPKFVPVAGSGMHLVFD